MYIEVEGIQGAGPQIVFCGGWSPEFTHHNVIQVGNGVDKCPDPLAVSLRVDGAGRRADGRTPRALLRVLHLHKMKGPTQVLWAATLWEERVPLEQLPYFFNNEHACS